MILCTLLTVGCSSVGGSAVGDGAAPSPTISVVAPNAIPDTPDAETSTGPASEPTGPGSSGTPDTRPSGATAGPSTTSATPSVTPAPSTSTGRNLSLDRFQSPSRNIGCVIEEGLSVRCDLGESAITEKHDCNDIGDWGQSIALDRGRKAAMQCASDTVLDPAVAVLAYGSSTRVGSITCTSSQDGIRCTDDLGHGFRLSRASYEVR